MILKPASPQQEDFIRKCCNEDVNTRNQDLKTIKEWLKKQPHLPDSWDDAIIMNYLRNCKFSLEKTKKKLDRYFTMRTIFPELFSNRDIRSQELQEVFNYIILDTMPELAPECRRLNIGRFISSSQDSFRATNLIKLLLMLADLSIKIHETGVTGDVFIIDVGELSLNHVKEFTPTLLKKFFTCLQEALPYKIKEVHLVNPSPLLDYLLKLVLMFLKEKLKKRIHTHLNLESLHNFVPKEILPEEFGGFGGKIQEDRWAKICLAHSTWFEEHEGVKADESKRPKECMWHDDLFGVDGSFKQLTID